MKLLGLIGYPLSHSFSKKYFTQKFENEGLTHDWQYELFPIESINQLPDLLRGHPNLVGLNVTIPYKEDVMYWLDELDETAEAIGAVNCIKIVNGKLNGYNTDYYGFQKSLLSPPRPQRGSLDVVHSEIEMEDNIEITDSLFGCGRGLDIKALILGTGGSAKAVAYALKKLKIPYQYVSRHKSAHGFTYADLDKSIMASHQLIVNCTPLGMSPNTEGCPPIPYEYLDNQHFMYDLIYNPEESTFLKKGKERGAKVKSGLDMLHFQAEKGWEIWNEVYSF